MLLSVSTYGLHNHKQQNELLKPVPLHSHGKYSILLFQNVVLDILAEASTMKNHIFANISGLQYGELQ